MSDDLEIRGGGVVAVDTESLRHASARWLDVAATLDRVRGELQSAARLVTADSYEWMPLLLLADDADALHDLADEIARDLRHLAELYEIVELGAARDLALAAGDTELAATLTARLDHALATPYALAQVRALTQQWHDGLPDQFQRQLGETVRPFAPFLGGVLGTYLFGSAVSGTAAGTVRRLGHGTPGAALIGPAPRVTVTPLRQAVTTAPSALADLAARMPGGGSGRVRVERYTWPDGSRQFAVYAAGTQWGGDADDEVWNMPSNLELYSGQQSESYAATVNALRDAGAQPGDTVDVVGYSQGGMIASYLALDEGYDVPMLVTMGSPVQAEVGPDTLSVALRHADDPVSSLAGGGLATVAGAAGSIVAERVVDPGRGIADIGAHDLAEYARTAELLDASPDPRMDAVRARFAQLGTAASVEVIVYGAEPAPPLRPREPTATAQ